MDDRLKDYENKMTKTHKNLLDEFQTIRAGRANPHVLDKIKVMYYGAETPLQQVANVTVTDARTITIQPWETSLLKEIEKALEISDIGINPINDGKVIRLTFPVLTEDRRKELVKEVKKLGEEGKVAIRNIRRDGNDAFKKLKAEDVSEDEIRDLTDSLQKLTDDYIKKIDSAVEDKTRELMTI
jgi:ribosome recycling factor